MALVPCAECRQPFYAACHDSSCIDAVCPHCEYADDGHEVVTPAGAEAAEAPTVSIAAPARLAEAQRR